MTPYNWSEMKDSERGLRALEELVRILAGHVSRRGSRPMCHGCAWERAVKPLLSPLVGWGRGDVPESADEPDAGPIIYNLSDIPEPVRIPATTEMERFLRTSEAYDIASDVLLDILYRADPARGCGTGYASDADLLHLHGEGERGRKAADLWRQPA